MNEIEVNLLKINKKIFNAEFVSSPVREKNLEKVLNKTELQISRKIQDRILR